jgi:hypothetical protein
MRTADPAIGSQRKSDLISLFGFGFIEGTGTGNRQSVDKTNCPLIKPINTIFLRYFILYKTSILERLALAVEL